MNNFLENSDFRHALDKLDMDLEEAEKEAESNKQFFSDITVGLVMSLTAGFVSWLLRAGTLLASFISVAPLWKHFDPIPVLGSGKKKEQEDENNEDAEPIEDTSIETFFDDKKPD